MKTSELIKSLSDAYKKLKDSEEKFEVHEVVEPIGSTGFFRFVFAAKKKKKLGLFGAIVSIARNVAYYGARGAVYGIAQEIANRKMQEEMNLEPIDREITGGELALIFARWIETIPKGYIETIGNTIALPKEEKYLSEQFVGRLATSVRNRPHVTPVRFGLKYGRIFIDISKDSKKMRNIMKNNKVAFVVDDYLEKDGVKYARGLLIEGEAEIHENDKVYQLGRHLINEKYKPELGFRRGFSENRAIIVIKPKKVSSWGL